MGFVFFRAGRRLKIFLGLIFLSGFVLGIHAGESALGSPEFCPATGPTLSQEPSLPALAAPVHPFGPQISPVSSRLITAVAHAGPLTQYTIVRYFCLAAPANTCAFGMYGTYATKDACIAANGGRLESVLDTGGAHDDRRCEQLLPDQMPLPW